MKLGFKPLIKKIPKLRKKISPKTKVKGLGGIKDLDNDMM